MVRTISVIRHAMEETNKAKLIAEADGNSVQIKLLAQKMRDLNIELGQARRKRKKS